MLATPLYPAPPFSPGSNAEDSAQYRPARDVESFNSLLPPAVEFVEGSSSGTLAVAEGKYEPINASPKAHSTPQPNGTLQVPPPTPAKSSHKSKLSDPKSQISPLYTKILETSWPNGVSVGSGLSNMGNTCFLNSALQCLLHTPPLLRVLWAHKGRDDPCCVKQGGFCMICALRQVMIDSHSGKRHPFNPFPITTKMQAIAKHMRKGRQEDSHEFLRYAIDALQKSCLAGHPPKIDPKLAETTWVHKMFGGRLRSRVTCQDCHYNSDTYDGILDLSIDIHDCGGLRDALKRFVAVDVLKGQNKYKCEKCKKAVIAHKRFTVHDAPLVLTVHLKRFTPLGRKIGHPLKYEERLSLQPYMSDGQYGPTYSLYGVICHAGGGPNSGHYYAYVKASDDKWYEMNDDSVTPHHGTPVNVKNAYILFYMRDKGQALEAAVSSVPPSRPAGSLGKTGIAAAMKKRKERDDDEDVGVRTAPSPPTRFIGPVLPPYIVASRANAGQSAPRPDPQAAAVKKKIAAVVKSPALQNLAQYTDDDDDEGEGEKPCTPPATVDLDPKPQNEDKAKVDSSSSNQPPSPSPAPPPPPLLPTTPVKAPVPPSSFYAPLKSDSDKKWKPPGGRSEDTRDWARKPLAFSSPPRNHGNWRDHRGRGSAKRHSSSYHNPYNRLSGGNNLRSQRDDGPNNFRRLQKYGGKKRRMLI